MVNNSCSLILLYAGLMVSALVMVQGRRLLSSAEFDSECPTRVAKAERKALAEVCPYPTTFNELIETVKYYIKARKNGGICQYVGHDAGLFQMQLAPPNVMYVDKYGCTYRCACYSDTLESDSCSTSPCINGDCVRGIGSQFTCDCNDGYIGELCDEIPDPCDAHPCVNGTCVRGTGSQFTCDCNDGYIGELCDEIPDPCDAHPCVKGTCVRGTGSQFTCDCNDGYIGELCDEIPDPCDAHPCVNGTCVRGTGSLFTCDCNDGYIGELCDEIPDPCDAHPCVNGTCVRGTGSQFTCDCNDGYIGELCDEIPDPCDAHPCVKGTCVRGTGSQFTCDCNDGYIGELCDEIPDPCDAHPCVNGTCVRGTGSQFTCDCNHGYIGDLCDEIPDPCAAHPCNNGACVRGNGSQFTCNCNSGYVGQLCDLIDITALQSWCEAELHSADVKGGFFNTANGHCYLLVDAADRQKNVDEAYTACRSRVPTQPAAWSRLAHITDESIFDGLNFAENFKKNIQNIWVGLRYINGTKGDKSSWYWVNGPQARNPVSQLDFVGGSGFFVISDSDAFCARYMATYQSRILDDTPCPPNYRYRYYTCEFIPGSN